MKSIILFILFIGVLLVVYNQKSINRSPPIVQFRYIPREFIDEQYSRLPLLSLYGSLFTSDDNWLKSVGQSSIIESKKEVY